MSNSGGGSHNADSTQPGRRPDGFRPFITIRPEEGLEVDLTQVTKTHLPHGGNDFLSLGTLFMDDLKRFFPRVRVQPNTALYYYTEFESGPELASTTIPLSRGRLPMKEVEALEQSWQAFLARKTDPKTDPRARDVMQYFRLPDPLLEPEFYRLYGPRWNRRLLVLWGLEKKPRSSLPVAEATIGLRRKAQPEWLRWLLIILPLILALLALLGLLKLAGCLLFGPPGKPPPAGTNQPPIAPTNMPGETRTNWSRGDLTNLPPQVLTNLPPQVLTNLPPAALTNLPPQVLTNLPPAALTNLPPQVLTILPPAALTNLPPQVLTNLSPAALTNLPPQVLTNLSPAALTNLPPQVLTNLSPAALTNLPPQVLTNLPPAALTNLPPQVLTNLPPAALTNLPPQVLTNLSPAALTNLPPQVLINLSPEVKGLPPEVLEKPPPSATLSIVKGKIEKDIQGDRMRVSLTLKITPPEKIESATWSIPEAGISTNVAGYSFETYLPKGSYTVEVTAQLLGGRTVSANGKIKVDLTVSGRFEVR
jgi:hypothetical protein